MSASKIKGSLLEYIIRRLLTNCGFTKVIPDNLFIYHQRGLNFMGIRNNRLIYPIQSPFQIAQSRLK